MDNQDKIFEQIKTAAQKAEHKDFPSMEKVWSRVEEKIDAKVLETKNKLWKKIALAASVLLIISLGYQFIKSDKKTILPKNELVGIDTVQSIVPKPILEKKAVVESEIIKKDADKILNRQIATQTKLAVNDNKTPESVKTDKVTDAVMMNEISADKKSGIGQSQNTDSRYLLKRRIFDAISVHHTPESSNLENTKKEAKAATQKLPPLVVINGKAIANKSENRNSTSGEQEFSELDKDEIESVVLLKEPLYIINGVYYSEQDLFGSNPSSPYAPLDKQEIKTITILQDEEATSVYGEKGKKGVVIITTKTGKPVAPK
jgi:TonB-dependent SusC/RagA subfamily outer membrane receptor